MMTPDPQAFAQEWAEAWNARDVEAVLAHFHDDAVFSSPIAARMGHGRNGIVAGKPAIRNYWNSALQLHPHLAFSIESVHLGVDSLLIIFTAQDGLRRAEMLIFDQALVVKGYGMGPAELGLGNPMGT